MEKTMARMYISRRIAAAILFYEEGMTFKAAESMLDQLDHEDHRGECRLIGVGAKLGRAPDPKLPRVWVVYDYKDYPCDDLKRYVARMRAVAVDHYGPNI